jgi:hypothetical protein
MNTFRSITFAARRHALWLALALLPLILAACNNGSGSGTGY